MSPYIFGSLHCLQGVTCLFLFFLFLFFTGKFAFFKAIVIGDPTPTVTWSRNNGDVSDTSRYQSKYDSPSNEHTFEASDTVKLKQHVHIKEKQIM